MTLSISQLFKRQYVLFFTTFLMLFSAQGQTKKWKIDPTHSNIGFAISYFNVGEIKGTFDDYSGSFESNDTIWELSAVKITLKTASINTSQSKRDEHLRTAEFFNANKYPEISFTSTSFKKISEKEYELNGNLTMSGITKPITLKATHKGGYVHPRFKNNRKFLTITGEILREDFNVGTNYPPAKFALGKQVDLVAEIHLIEE